MKKLLYAFLLTFPLRMFATDYTSCVGPDAYSDAAHTVRVTTRDWICQLNEDVAGARCPNAQQRACEGGTMLGPHDVPNGGVYWFWATSTINNMDVKCTCGCFAPDTHILTENGAKPIEFLLDVAKRQPIRVYQRVEAEQRNYLDLSRELRAPDFTHGKEEKPLVRLAIANGSLLKLTDKHPVLVLRDHQEAMVRAKDLLVGDLVLDQFGDKHAITQMSAESLQSEVINFASQDPAPLHHVVIANGIQVGDNLWQKSLDVFHSRQEIRQHGDLAYVKTLGRNER